MKKNFIYLAFSLSCIGMLFSCTSEMDEFDDFQNAVVSRSVSTTSSLTYPISSFAQECSFSGEDLSEFEEMLSLM